MQWMRACKDIGTRHTSKPRKEAPETNPVDTSMLNFHRAELRENKALLLMPSALQYAVVGALEMGKADVEVIHQFRP